MTVRELIENLKKLDPNKSISAFTPWGYYEVEFEIVELDEDGMCAWISLEVL